MQNQTIESGKVSINEATPQRPHTRSKFNLGYPFFETYRFGQYAPFFWMEAVPGDNTPLRSSHNVRSYTLEAPLMNDIKLKKDYFMVPREAILPLNWEKIQDNPTIGDDIDASTYGTSISRFYSKIKTMLNTIRDYWIFDTSSVGHSNTTILTWVFKYLVTAEMFFSRGSLMNNLGIPMGNLFNIKDSNGLCLSRNFDEFFDKCIAKFLNIMSNVEYFSINVGNLVYTCSNDQVSYPNSLTIREGLEIMRDNIGNFTIGTQFETEDISSLTDINTLWGTSQLETLVSEEPIDIARILAYQIICYHFYSNDHVDYIYSAELYRQYIKSCITKARNAAGPVAFILNGITYEADYLSGAYFNAVYNTFVQYSSTESTVKNILNYLQAIFQYKRSLKYVDYFTGAKTQPLAVGDVTAAVSSNKVSAIDMTQAIQTQRFLNAVNRAGRKVGEYIKGIFGVENKPDYHNPFFLAHTEDTIISTETENTGAAQLTDANSVTSVLRSNAERYAFETFIDRNCIIIGIQYFDIERAYINATERQVFHVDRYDMFNPFMQTIGDQTVLGNEIEKLNNTNGIWGYQQRHAEYKQRYAQAAGGFANNALPGWTFVTDEKAGNGIIGPDFIRSKPTELDKFFVSLTGYSYGTYFHFIVKTRNIMEASRPMAYNPGIL